jgi:ketosteroid isomerase-like protein
MTKEFAIAFSGNWLAAWNSHNIDEILKHYSEDFSIETPMALKLFPESNGLINGKHNIRKYWTVALERIPNLKFEILDVLMGVSGLTIYYINLATNKKSVEIMNFNTEGKVNKVMVHYAE